MFQGSYEELDVFPVITYAMYAQMIIHHSSNISDGEQSKSIIMFKDVYIQIYPEINPLGYYLNIFALPSTQREFIYWEKNNIEMKRKTENCTCYEIFIEMLILYQRINKLMKKK